MTKFISVRRILICMNFRNSLLIPACLWLGCLFVNFAPAAPVTAQPNIVLIIADDLGYGDLGCYGATKIKTPNMDQLAAQGVRFTQGYAPSSTCTPSRFSLLTGMYAWRQKDKKNSILDGDAPLCIDVGRSTLPAMLHKAGYQTGIVGKWHLGLGDGVTPVNFNGEIKPGPLEVGFDYCYIIPATVDRVPSVWIENHRVVGLNPADPITVNYVTNISPEPTGLDAAERPELLTHYRADKQHSGTIINGISRIGYMSGGKNARFKDEELAPRVVEKSIAFIEKNKNQPFFLEAALFEPHVPRVAGTNFAGTSDCGLRGDVIQQIDWEAGEIMAALKRLNLETNTLVILSSDNGAILFDGYYDHSVEDLNGHQPTGGLRGWKYLVFEGGCRVPLIARWPAQIQPRVSDQLFNLVDFYATFAGLTDQHFSKADAPDSLDLSAALLRNTMNQIRSNTVLHGLSDMLALRAGDWKFIPANNKAKASGMGAGADSSSSRFAANQIKHPLLFNLASDPDEKTNVIAKFPDQADALQKQLLEIKRQP
jgi:arylsulfatase A-like enzyme